MSVVLPHLPRLYVETHVGQRPGAAGVFEVHAFESHGAGCPADRRSVRRLLDHWLGVEDVKGHSRADLVLERMGILRRCFRRPDSMRRRRPRDYRQSPAATKAAQ